MAYEEDEDSFLSLQDRLDQYLELLYEQDLRKNNLGCQYIARFCQDEDALNFLVNHRSALGCLARLLHDKGARSIKLCRNIIAIFHVLSQHVEYHKRILGYKIIQVVLDKIHYENRRFQTFISDSTLSAKKRRDFLHLQSRLLLECLRILYNLFGHVPKDESLVLNCVRILRRDDCPQHTEMDDLLAVALQLLQGLFLRPEEGLEGTYRLTNLFEAIMPLLNTRVLRILDTTSDRSTRLSALGLCSVIVGFLSHFVHDELYRRYFIDSIPTLLRCCEIPDLQAVSLVVVYEVSKDPNAIPVLSTHRACKRMADLCTGSPTGAPVPKEIVAVAVNLAHELPGEFLPHLQGLLSRLFQTPDGLFAKLIRTISQNEAVRPHLAILAGPVSQNLNRDETIQNQPPPGWLVDPAMLPEMLGILNNLTSVEAIDFSILFLQRKYNLAKVLNRFLRLDEQQDDVLLESTMLVGSALAKTQNVKVAKVISNTKIIEKIAVLFVERQEDEEMVLQCLQAFHSFLCFKPSRLMLFEYSTAITMVVGLVDHQNRLIARVVDQLLDMIADLHEGFRESIVRIRFERHNAEWCAQVSQEDDGVVGTMPFGDSMDMNVSQDFLDDDDDEMEGEGELDEDLGDSLDSFNQISHWGSEDYS